MGRNELSAISVWRYMMVEGKWQSLWRGNLVNVLKTAPENAIRLATYEKLKDLISQNRAHRINSFNEKLMCGSAAGFLATLTLYPLKTVKTIMNLGHTGEFSSIIDCINKTYSKYGVRGFYRGLVANSLAIIPSAGIDLAMYETLKKKYSELKNKPEPSMIEKLILGNVSSAFGNFVVYPLFFARTRLQSNRNPHENTINVLLHVLRKDGAIGLYRGFILHALKIGPAASISYVTFESVTKIFSISSLN
jgi:solute carrier family 25 (mitochondrial phosphate transporter), member 23/24/25/41